jgi:hypothetical protein
MKLGSMPCEFPAKSGSPYIPGKFFRAANVSGFFCV